MQLEIDGYYLRPINVDDVDAFYRWSLDRQVTIYSLSSYAYPQSKADIEKWLTSINSNSKNVSFGICEQESHRLIGYAGLVGISTINRCGEFFILIGEKEYWGRGIGSSITQIVTDYAFKTLGLHRVELTASAANKGAIAAYSKAGFQHEGIMRQASYRNGEFVDKVFMSVLSTEWKGLDNYNLVVTPAR